MGVLIANHFLGCCCYCCCKGQKKERSAGWKRAGLLPAGASGPQSELEAANRKNGTFRSLRTFHLAPVFILAVVGRLPVQRWKRKRVQTATSNLWEPNSRKSAAFQPAAAAAAAAVALFTTQLPSAFENSREKEKKKPHLPLWLAGERTCLSVQQQSAFFSLSVISQRQRRPPCCMPFAFPTHDRRQSVHANEPNTSSSNRREKMSNAALWNEIFHK